MGIKRAALLFGCLSVPSLVASATATNSFVPPVDGYDWLQLDSDEWLKGELVRVFEDEILFDSDHFGQIKIDLEDVQHLRSDRSFGIRIENIGVVEGSVRIDTQSIVVIGNEAEISYAREDIVAVAATAERERDRWSGDVGLGINLRRGNTETFEYNMLAGLARRTPETRLLFDYLGNFNETEGIEVENNHRVNLSLDLFTGGRFFWRPLIGQYYRDPFQNIKHQGSLETGGGYELIDTARTDWDLTGSLGANFINFVSVQPGEPDDNTSPALSLGTDLEIELTSWIDYLLEFQMTFLDEQSGTYQHHLLTTLSTDLIGEWDMDVSFIWDRTENPQPRADGTVPEQDDFRLLFGLGVDF